MIEVLKWDDFHSNFVEISLSIILYLYFTFDLNFSPSEKSYLYTFLEFRIYVYATFKQAFYPIILSIFWVVCNQDLYNSFFLYIQSFILVLVLNT